MAIPVVPQNTTTFSRATDAAIKKTYVDTYSVNEPKIELIYAVETQTSKTDEYDASTGLSGKFSEISEAELYPVDAPIPDYYTNFTVSKRGTTAQVTWETKWIKTKAVANAGKQLADAVKKDIGYEMGSVLTGGWATPASTVMALSDGKDFFSIGCLRADGGTAFSNTSASSIVLSEVNLWVGMIALANQPNGRGDLTNFSATKLIVAKDTANEKTARIILNSDKRSETGDNDMNLYKGMLDLVTNKYLGAAATGTTAHNGCWYLVDANADPYPLLWQWGQKPMVETDSSVGFNNDIIVYKIKYERSKGFQTHRGIWASYGDGSTTIAD